jgi:hypothetical protein
VVVGSNTSTVTLRVVGGDEKGSLKSETVKYGPKESTSDQNIFTLSLKFCIFFRSVRRQEKLFGRTGGMWQELTAQLLNNLEHVMPCRSEISSYCACIERIPLVLVTSASHLNVQ